MDSHRGLVAGSKASAAAGVDRLADRTTATFAPDGPLARAVPDFEPRAGQVDSDPGTAAKVRRVRILLIRLQTV